MFLGGVSLNLSEKTTLAWYVSAGRFGNGIESFFRRRPGVGRSVLQLLHLHPEAQRQVDLRLRA